MLVTVDALKPGDIVGAAVLNAAGATLVSAGTALSFSAIKSLKLAGISSVVLQRGEAEVRACRTLYQRRLGNLHVRFAGTDDPVLLRFKVLIQDHLCLLLDSVSSNQETSA